MNILIVGRSGLGKTTLALYLAQQYSRGVFIWDPTGSVQVGYVVTTGDEFDEAIDERKWENGPIVYHPAEGADLNEAFDQACAILLTKTGFACVIDEAGLDLQSPHRLNKRFRELVISHRRINAVIIQASHFLADFHRASKGLMNELYIFRTTHPGTLANLEEFTGDQDLPKVVEMLANREVVRYHLDAQMQGESQYEIWRDPERWRVSLTTPEAAYAV